MWKTNLSFKSTAVLKITSISLTQDNSEEYCWCQSIVVEVEQFPGACRAGIVASPCP